MGYEAKNYSSAPPALLNQKFGSQNHKGSEPETHFGFKSDLQGVFGRDIHFI